MPARNGMGRHTTPLNVPEAPVFRPTMDEFRDFNKYVQYLETTDFPKAGICRVIPPAEWIPRKIGYNVDDLKYIIEGPVKQHFNQVGVKGTYQTKGIIKPAMSVKEYYELANSHTYRTPNHSSYDDLERKYWKSLSFCPPIYGCDVADRLTDPDVKEWNIANLGSVLDLIKEEKELDIKGVLSPYLYFGMWKATFSWHIEDMDLYAINFVHHGAPKTWYCVPPQYGHLLEKAAREIFPTVASWCSNFMRHKTCMISPEMLDKYGVPYQKVVQEERNIILTYPYAYHCGFNHGFNIAESTNFATEKWVEYGKRSRPCDCSRSRVTFSMDNFVKKYQPDRYEDWINKRDIAPHPEDPPEVVAEIKLRAENPAAYKAMMEERMKLKEDKKRAKPGRQSKAEPEEAEPEELITVDIYQNPERKNVMVEVNPTTMRCRGIGMALIREFLDEGPDPDVKDLIGRGILIKIGSKQVPKSKRSHEDDDDDADGEKVDVLIYKHVGDDEIEAVVDPVSLELVGPQTDNLIEFLQNVNMPIRALIEMSIFTNFIEAKICVAREPESDPSGPPPNKKVKLEDLEAAKVSGPVRVVELHRYKNPITGMTIKVNPTTMTSFYKLSAQAKYFLRERTVKEVIEDGLLVFDGTQEVIAKLKVADGAKAEPVINLDSAPATPKPGPLSATTSRTSESGRRSFPADMYRSADGKFLFAVSRKTMKVLGRRSEELQKFLDGRSIQELIESKDLVFVGERKVKEKEADATSHADVEQNLDDVKAEVKDEPDDDVRMSVDAAADDDNEVEFIEEEDPEEVAKATAVVQRRMMAVPDYDSDSDDDDEEMFYTTESSSDSNESSDDPNYGSSKKDGLWNRRSNKSKKRKLKKMKKLKMLSKQDREARRAMGSEERARRRELKSQKRARAVDAGSVSELTKKLIDHLSVKFHNVGADDVKVFDITELKEKFGEDRSNIISVIRIFEGLEFVKKVSEEEEDKYFWYGIDADNMNRIFLDILDGGKMEKENNIWLIFRDFVKVLLLNRKGTRVHPTIVGKSHYGVNETRRVTLIAAILEGLGLATRRNDSVGGVIWSGKDLLLQWHEEQCTKYYDEPEEIRQCSVALTEPEISEDQLEQARDDVKAYLESQHETPIISVEGLTSEQQRSVVNQKIVCKCGVTKKTTFAVEREGGKYERKSVWSGFKKRTRCKECAGCKAPKCNECQFCLKPHLKKPCIGKVCQFPVVPKCPCFA